MGYLMEDNKKVDLTREETQSQLQEKYLQALDNIEDGCVLEGTVAAITGDTVFVDVGYKSEGRLSLEDFDNLPEVGDKISVLVVKKEGRGGQIQLSSKLATAKSDLKALEEAYEAKQPVEGKFIAIVKSKEGDKISGFDVKLLGDYKAFCPLSKADVNRVKKPEDFIGKKDYFIIEKFYKNSRLKSIVNRKAYLDSQINEIKKEFFDSVQVGDVVEGTVKSYTDFGIFVDLGGFDGLLHMNDMAWGRISNPRDSFKKGEKYQLRVVGIDKDKQKINLSYKDMTADPWLSFEEKYHLDDIVEGKIVKLTDFGVFVELEPGVEGLAHVSELSWTTHVSHPSELFKVGDTVKVKILGYDIGARRISLGVRQTQANPWDTIKDKYPVGTRLTRPIVKVMQAGAFVNLEEGIDGFIPSDSISWTEKVKDAREVLKVGEEKEVVVSKVDTEGRRIRLSLRDTNDNPWAALKNNYPKGSIIEAEVTAILDNGISVKVEGDIEATINKHNLIENEEENLNTVLSKYNVGDKISAMVVDIAPQQNRLLLSVHDAAMKERKDEYARYVNSAEDEGSFTLADIFEKKDDN